MGHTLLYSHELTSTQTILMDNFRNYQSGLVCVADKQISGHGRSTNKWDSPYGCLMFSFKTHITNPRDLPMLQYLTTLVMCNSLEDIYKTGVHPSLHFHLIYRIWTLPLNGQMTFTTIVIRRSEVLFASHSTMAVHSR